MPSVRYALSLASLRETRSRLRQGRGWLLAGGVAAAYAFLSMLIGQMLYFERIGGSYFVQVLWGGNGQQWWNYPGLLAVEPWGVVSLPFFATLSMVIVSLGVGIGVTVGVLLVLPALRRRNAPAARAGVTGAAAGAGPAITGLATLGACCCTTCAGAAGISVIAATSGASLAELVRNDWYIGVFQMAVVYVALVAQERSLRLSAADCPLPPPLDRRFAAGAVLRIGLLVAGITWSLAMFIEWGDTNPWTAPASTWYHWIFEHQLLSVVAISAGMFPQEFSNLVRRGAVRSRAIPARLALALAAVTWGVWVPPALVSAGLGGFLNEALGVWGAPAGWGAVSPDAALGAPLYFHWAFQHLLLAAFGLVVAVAPRTATAPLLWTVGGERPVGDSAATASPPGPSWARPNPPVLWGAASGGTPGNAPNESPETS